MLVLRDQAVLIQRSLGNSSGKRGCMMTRSRGATPTTYEEDLDSEFTRGCEIDSDSEGENIKDPVPKGAKKAKKTKKSKPESLTRCGERRLTGHLQAATRRASAAAGGATGI